MSPFDPKLSTLNFKLSSGPTAHHKILSQQRKKVYTSTQNVLWIYSCNHAGHNTSVGRIQKFTTSDQKSVQSTHVRLGCSQKAIA